MHLRLEWKGKELFYNNEPLGTNDELQAARVLLDRNLAERSDAFTTYRGEMPCLKAGIGWAADREVSSHMTFVPRTRRRAS